MLKKRAIFGGSFDPPHIGHLRIVEKAMEKLDIDILTVLPNFQNPWKNKTFYSPNKRFDLLKKIFDGFNKVEISSYEIDLQRPVKSIESVRYFAEQSSKLYLIIGSDNLSKLHLWDEFPEIEKLVEFVVATRNNIYVSNKFIKLNINENISSTELRTNLNLAFIPENIRELICN